ncbi:kinase-like domain-containing protein [Aspergillus undulatus]|uniref:kinase-like domain-containing protein n=1 Tax=Aspergillus undulatus TaxID=1810928 RepID=UPI003CCDF4FB
MEPETSTLNMTQRITQFPRSGDAVPLALFKPTEDTQNPVVLPNRLQKRAKPIRRIQLPIKRTTEEPGPASKRLAAPALCKQGTPWSHFKICMQGDPGKACLAYNISSPGIVVAIKQYRNTGIDKTQYLMEVCDTNVISILTVFVDQATIYIAYERMDVTLEQLHSSVNLDEVDIGFICKEVLRGLWYIHRNLKVCHTRIRSNKIFLNTQGSVKIGDIGASLLEQHHGSEQIDIKSVGWIMTEIMEPGSALANPRSIHLASPDNWSSNIRHFQIQTQTQSAPELLQHVFLGSIPESDSGLLVVPVLKAKGTAVHLYE